MSRVVYAILIGVAASNACEVYVSVEAGKLCGLRRWAEDGRLYASFRGVPYARQPLRHLRFKELQRVQPWKGVLKAYEEGPICPQEDRWFGQLMGHQLMDEACIYANIHVPLKALTPGPTQKSLPILVFVHGGAFQSGSGDSDMYGPEYLVTQDIIVVTFNYRLNVFGFLSLNTSSVPGNQGLRDQVTLLKWVRRNARHFGGNPDEITLMGQGSGATCVHLLALSEATSKLFKRVILQSGTAFEALYTASKKYASMTAKWLLNELGINSQNPNKIHEALIRVPYQVLLRTYSRKIQDSGLLYAFAPVVESQFKEVTRIVDRDPDEMMSQGSGRNIPFLIGFNADECHTIRKRIEQLKLASLAEKNPMSLLFVKLIYNLKKRYLLEIGNKILKRYFKDNATMDNYLRFCSESYFEYPALAVARQRAEQEIGPVFLYRFDYVAKQTALGERAGHLEDTFHVFRNNGGERPRRFWAFPPYNDDDAMKWQMAAFVANFTKFGAPTGEQRAIWPELWPIRLELQDISQPEVFNYVTIDERLQRTVDFYDFIMEYSAIVKGESRQSGLDLATGVTGSSHTQRSKYDFLPGLRVTDNHSGKPKSNYDFVVENTQSHNRQRPDNDLKAIVGKTKNEHQQPYDFEIGVDNTRNEDLDFNVSLAEGRRKSQELLKILRDLGEPVAKTHNQDLDIDISAAVANRKKSRPITQSMFESPKNDFDSTARLEKTHKHNQELDLDLSAAVASRKQYISSTVSIPKRRFEHVTQKYKNHYHKQDLDLNLSDVVARRKESLSTTVSMFESQKAKTHNLNKDNDLDLPVVTRRRQKGSPTVAMSQAYKERFGFATGEYKTRNHTKAPYFNIFGVDARRKKKISTTASLFKSHREGYGVNGLYNYKQDSDYDLSAVVSNRKKSLSTAKSVTESYKKGYDYDIAVEIPKTNIEDLDIDVSPAVASKKQSLSTTVRMYYNSQKSRKRVPVQEVFDNMYLDPI